MLPSQSEKVHNFRKPAAIKRFVVHHEALIPNSSKSSFGDEERIKRKYTPIRGEDGGVALSTERDG